MTKTTINKGDIVLIKASDEAPGVRRVWDANPERPFVCHEVYWERWEQYQLEPVCWQVSRSQIYQADQDLANRLADAHVAYRSGAPNASSQLSQLWKQASPL